MLAVSRGDEGGPVEEDGTGNWDVRTGFLFGQIVFSSFIRSHSYTSMGPGIRAGRPYILPRCDTFSHTVRKFYRVPQWCPGS